MKKTIAYILILIVVAGGSFFGGLKMGAKGYTYSGHDFKIVNQNQSPKDVDYSLLWQALDALNTKYIDKPLDQQKLLYGAVSGLVSAAGDPYTTFFDPDQYASFQTQLSGSFEGIGAEVGLKDNHVIIVSPLDGSPAKKAGLLSGDAILKIDGQDATQFTLEQAVDKIRGKKGTTVKLQISRSGADKPLEFTITRDTINVNSVKWSTQTVNNKKIEIISISEFGDDTVDLFRQAAIDAQSKSVQGIVVDLRDDPGGYLDAAISIASYWVTPNSLVVSEQHSDGTVQKYNAKGNDTLHDIPTVAITNSGTASAAEILAGALRDNGQAKLVGTKSFGKGSVQELVNLPFKTALKVTIAKWLTPKGVNLNHNGLDPDYKVDLAAGEPASSTDAQMTKALDLLK